MTAALLESPATTTRRRRLRLPRSRKLLVGLAILGVFVIVGIIGPIVFPGANATSPDAFASPSRAHLLGTTNLGQDVFQQVANGTRGSLTVGLVAGVLSTLVAMVVGIVAGYIGGLTDDALSLLGNVVLVIPSLPLIILITNYVNSRSYLTIALVIAATAWASTSRVLRTQTLSLRNRDFVDAARVAGESTWRIIAYEVMPNLLPIIANSLVFSGLFAILTEAGLDFLGLGTVNASSWGSILYYAQNAQALSLGAWWWFVPPGLCIALVGMALSLINFSIDELVNPRLRVAARVTANRSAADARQLPAGAVAGGDADAATQVAATGTGATQSQTLPAERVQDNRGGYRP